MMARQKITDETYYHVYNRGVEKRNVFLDDGDRMRFIHHLYEFNTTEESPTLSYHLGKARAPKEVGPPKSETLVSRKRKPLVDIVAFVLMPNHYHLVLRQRCDNGISLFMQKLGTGYTMFFNAKHEHSGVLFQGKYKYKPVDSHQQMLYLPHYVHLNPVPLLENSKSNVGGRTSLIEQLLEYRWSSLPDYAGKRNFPALTTRGDLLEMFGGPSKYLADLKGVLGKEDVITTELFGVSMDEHERHIF